MTDLDLSELNIHQRIAQVMKEVKYIQKDARVDDKYNAITHDQVTARIRKYLIKNGINAYTSVTDVFREQVTIKTKYGERQAFRTSVTISVCFICVDKPEDSLTITSIGTGEDHGDKADGKALSYAVKYAFLKIFLLESGDEEESRLDREEKQGQSVISPDRRLLLDRYNFAAQALIDAIGAESATDQIRKMKAGLPKNSPEIADKIEELASNADPMFRPWGKQ